MSFPLAIRKNLKENEKVRDENIARINASTGTTWDFEPDLENLYKALKPKYQEQIGNVIYNSYLGGLATNIENFCKDDMCKEALVEAITGKAVTMVVNGEVAPSYNPVVKIESGKLVIYVNDNSSSENFPCNAGNTGNDLMSLL